tara:strand:- start:803 stop:1798 length:996 start_codon:yes stop_codon:yes gene_type:complete
MKKHFYNFYLEILGFIKKNDIEKPTIVEIGCNDGILLENFSSNGFVHYGVEPSKNVADIAKNKNIKVINDFFGQQSLGKIRKEIGKVDFFLAANVICHIEDLKSVFKNVSDNISDKGVFVFEDPYLGDVIEKTSYDQIYDEHVYLFSCLSLSMVAKIFDMELIDAKHQVTHGGSMRYYIAKKSSYKVSKNVKDFLLKEKKQGLDNLKTFYQFSNNVKESKKKLIEILENNKKNNKKSCGYAATSKSTTILNYCKIDQNLIDFISDTTPIKQNKFSPGMHIPIKDYEYFKNNMPNYAFLFAWNHFGEINGKEKEFLSSGGRWITHVPSVKIL